jgi:TolA-binding protein
MNASRISGIPTQAEKRSVIQSPLLFFLNFCLIVCAQNSGAATPPMSASRSAKPSMQSAFPEGERLIYTRLIEAYRKGNRQELLSQRQLLEKNYPTSIHLDNAYNMVGMLEFQGGRYGEAIQNFQVIRQRFPKSNKRSSALFATAMAYDRLKLPAQSKRLIHELIQEYPGSPESLRAQMFLKLQSGAPGKTVKR